VRKICEPLSAGSNVLSKQPENIAETERVRDSLLGHINLMAKSRAKAWGQIEALKKIIVAGNQERDALVQRLNDMKKEEHK
jgi:type IV secretory pathway protease TraF